MHVNVLPQEYDDTVLDESTFDQRKIPLHHFTIGFQKQGICADSLFLESNGKMVQWDFSLITVCPEVLGDCVFYRRVRGPVSPDRLSFSYRVDGARFLISSEAVLVLVS